MGRILGRFQAPGSWNLQEESHVRKLSLAEMPGEEGGEGVAHCERRFYLSSITARGSTCGSPRRETSGDRTGPTTTKTVHMQVWGLEGHPQWGQSISATSP